MHRAPKEIRHAANLDASTKMHDVTTSALYTSINNFYLAFKSRRNNFKPHAGQGCQFTVSDTLEARRHVAQSRFPPRPSFPSFNYLQSDNSDFSEQKFAEARGWFPRQYSSRIKQVCSIARAHARGGSYLSRSQESVRSSLALLLRASSWRPAGCLTVISSRGTRANSASRSADVETRRTSAAPRLFRRKILRRPRSGWKRRFFGSATRQKLRPPQRPASSRPRKRETTEKHRRTPIRHHRARIRMAAKCTARELAGIFTVRARERLDAWHHPSANLELRVFALVLSHPTLTLRISITRRARRPDKITNSLLDNSVYRLTCCRSAESLSL